MSAPKPHCQKSPYCYFTNSDWDAILERYGHKCVHCGTTENLSVDHIVPRLGYYGPEVDVLTNLQPLCRSCNSKKGNRKPDGTMWKREETFWHQEIQRKAKIRAERIAKYEAEQQRLKEERKRVRDENVKRKALLLMCSEALGLSERDTIAEAIAHLATRKDIRDALAKAEAQEGG